MTDYVIDVSLKKGKLCCIVSLMNFDKNHFNLVDASEWLVVTLEHLATVIGCKSL